MPLTDVLRENTGGRKSIIVQLVQLVFDLAVTRDWNKIIHYDRHNLPPSVLVDITAMFSRKLVAMSNLSIFFEEEELSVFMKPFVCVLVGHLYMITRIFSL